MEACNLDYLISSGSILLIDLCLKASLQVSFVSETSQNTLSNEALVMSPWKENILIEPGLSFPMKTTILFPS